MNVKFSDFEIVPIMSSVVKRDISDELYFSSKYAKYISNSRLKNINPNERMPFEKNGQMERPNGDIGERPEKPEGDFQGQMKNNNI